MLAELIKRAAVSPREFLREKGTPFHDLGLEDRGLSDDQLIDAMIEHPILINRPLVVSALGVTLWRPSEVVLDLLPDTHEGPSSKEDGEQVIGDDGQRI